MCRASISNSYSVAMDHPPIDIIYRDEHLIAVYKPEGLLVHRSNIDRHETRFLLQTLRDQIGQHLYPVHRLDKPTSGLILFALSSEVAQQLQAVMDNDETRKEYLLVCRGYTPDSGIIDHPLAPIDDFSNKKRKRLAKRDSQTVTTKEKQNAITHYRCLNTTELNAAVDKYPKSRYSLVLAQIRTGRKHQIRRHFKHLSHPIIGCPKYGKSKHNHYFADKLDTPRLLLHAYRMQLNHPITHERLTLVAAPTGSFKALLEKFSWMLPELNT